MKKLTRGKSPTIPQVRRITGWSVVEMAAFFKIDRRAIYQYKEHNHNRLPDGRRFELMSRKPEIFEDE